jgi:hypothetical protein
MKLNPGELADKMTITQLKLYYCDDAELKESLKTKLDALRQEWLDMNPEVRVRALELELLSANHNIWQLEADIRNGILDDLQEIGRRALQIRNINRDRIELVNQINQHYDIPPEVKINHVSEKHHNSYDNQRTDQSNQSV